MNENLGGSGDPGVSMKRFVTQEELDETRRKRQEEWEKIRTADQPLECPEEEVDNRSLYERLQEQKQRKEDEYEDQFKLKNSIRGLDEDETKFLDFVSQKQIEINKARHSEEASILQEIKEASVSKISETKTSPEKKVAPKPQTSATQNRKSQLSILAGAVKRKSTDTAANGNEKKRKLSEEDDKEESADQPLRNKSSAQTAQIIGILPGLGAYNNDTSDSETSSDDESDLDFKLTKQKKIVIHMENE